MKAVAFGITLAWLTITSGWASMDESIAYQGRIMHAGSPKTGIVELTFRLYDQDASGSPIAAEQVFENWPVEDGMFQVELDFGSGMFDGSPRWLEVSVDGNTLQPRQRLIAAPVAVHALAGGDGSNWILSGNDIHYPSGNVGIGTDSPAARLQVAGTMIVGASTNQASSQNAFVSGGQTDYPNTAGFLGFVGGGQSNSASGSLSFVGGGSSNHASGNSGFVGGGFFNEDNGTFSFIGAGLYNLTGGYASFVGGGVANEASGAESFVAGGRHNIASGERGFIGGGQSNQASGQRSFAAGRRAKALHDGAFVWADNTDADFSSTAANQFVVRAEGGIGFGRAPQDRFEIYSSLQEQDQDFSFGTGALRVTLANDAGMATRFRVLGNGGVAIGGSYTSSGVPNLGLRVAGAVRLDTLGTGGATALCRNGSGLIAECAESVADQAMAAELKALKETLTENTTQYESRLATLEGLLRDAGFNLSE